MTGDQSQLAIHQERDVEAEGCNAPGDLLNLLFRMQPRILGITLELFNVAIDN
jgi:hypothetical protein